MSALLMGSRPLMATKELITIFGVYDAMFLQQLQFWIERTGKEKDGHKWVYNTYSKWQEQFPFLSIVTLKRIVKRLIDKDVIIVARYNKMKMDKTNWYSINYDKLKEYEPVSQSSSPLYHEVYDDITWETF